VDAYRGEVKQYTFLQYASFVAYFPQLIAGPIVTHDELIPQFMDEQRKQFSWENFGPGLYIFVLGLAKKVLIADTFGIAANWGFANVMDLDTTNAFFSSLAYTIQIYFDFSGYCDMAIGIAKMMNLELPVNFDSPYKALTIGEFWKHWHKTLTRFFTRYIYIPLGGSRRGKLRTYRNIMIIYLISGIWHGANYTFIFWGILHGVFSVVYRWKEDWFNRQHPAFNWLLTFSFVNIAWIFFRADSITYGLTFVKRLLVMEFGPVNENIVNAFLLPEIEFLLRNIPQLDFLNHSPTLLLTAFYGGAMALILGARNAREHMLSFRPNIMNLAMISLLLFWCVMSFSGISTFLYFNF
jgi:alginate O-acetyltransferase complex protein AlgI